MEKVSNMPKNNRLGGACCTAHSMRESSIQLCLYIAAALEAASSKGKDELLSSICADISTMFNFTMSIYLNHFAFGITSNVIWAALVDIGYIYNTPSQVTSYLVTFNSLGYLLGSISGSLYKWLNRQLTIVILVSSLAFTTSLVPYYGSLWLLFVCMVLNGIGGGTWDSNNNVWLVEMWPRINAPIIQASQFMYGAGTIVGPILVSPYVHGENTNTSYVSPDERKRSLALPFIGTGIIQIIVPIIFLILFLIRPYTKNNEINHTLDEVQPQLENVNRRSESKRALKLIMVAICLGTYDAAEIGYFFFSPSMFQYSKVLSAEEGAHVLSVLSAAYTIGRLVTAFISIKIRPDVIISYHFVIVIIAQSILFFGHDSPPLIYVGTVILGYGFSAMWPAILAFTDRYFRLSNRVGSLLFFFAGVFSLFTPFIVGPFLESNPLVLYAFEGFYILVSIILFIILRIWIGFHEPNEKSFSIFNK
ncbi:hypothetical protein BLOT_004933 [Blomia tropicalis]|nr:hypothetical protein BLOT_004933 [Blomia tropicalis]